MIYCTKCGNQNADDARSCFGCGNQFTGQGSSTPFSAAGAPGAPGAPGAQQPGSPWSAPQYGAPMARPAGGGLSGPPGENRDPIMVILYAFLTCGIYMYYWIYTTSLEIKNALGGREDINPTMDLVLCFVTCGLYIFYLAYRYPQLIMELQDRARLPRNDISTVSLILAIFGLSIVSFFMIQTELNKVWDASGRG